MTVSVALGQLRVFDDNGNGRIDLAEDRITGFQNETPIPQDSFDRDPRVRQVMKQLGVQTLQGILLSPARTFLTQLSEAKRLARDGEVSGVEAKLDLLEALARENGFRFNKNSRDKILKGALVNAVTFNFRRAERWVEQGARNREHYPFRNLALEYARRAQKEFGVSAQPLMDAISDLDKRWYEKNPDIKQKAIENAERAQERAKADRQRRQKEAKERVERAKTRIKK